MIRLGDVGSYDLFELDTSTHELAFVPHSGTRRVLLSDVEAFETKQGVDPALYLSFAIRMKRDGVEVYREFAATGRNESSN